MNGHIRASMATLAFSDLTKNKNMLIEINRSILVIPNRKSEV